MSAVQRLVVILLLALTAVPAAAAQSARLVVLVRHAEAGGEPERDPPLTEIGRERAAALATALADAAISAIVVSNLQRTLLTAEPVGRARGIPSVVVETTGGIEAHVQGVADAVRGTAPGEAVLVVGHSNTVPAIIRALGGPELADLCHGEFGRLFIMEMSDRGAARFIEADYGPPDEGC